MKWLETDGLLIMHTSNWKLPQEEKEWKTVKWLLGYLYRGEGGTAGI